MGLLLIVIILLSTIKCSRTASIRNRPMIDMSDDNDNDDAEVEEERRVYDLNKLRHFLLTSNAEQLAAKREQQELYKRELVNKLNFFLKKSIEIFLFSFSYI